MSISNISGGLNAYQSMATLESKTTQQSLQSSSKDGQGGIDVSQMTIRNERQASLVNHLFGDPSTAPASSLKMTFQAAIDKLNEVLKGEIPEGEESPENAISSEKLKEQGGMEYWTPENTAERIVSGATAFLSGFQNAHPELEGEELMTRFMDVVGGGLEQGFNDAKGILGNLDVFEKDIESNFNSTFDLVTLGMTNFKNNYLGITPPISSDE